MSQIKKVVLAYSGGLDTSVIIDGRVPHSIIVEMLTDEGLGTMFIK